MHTKLIANYYNDFFSSLQAYYQLVTIHGGPKTCHYIPDYNSRAEWPFCIVFITLETTSPQIRAVNFSQYMVKLKQ